MVNKPWIPFVFVVCILLGCGPNSPQTEDKDQDLPTPRLTLLSPQSGLTTGGETVTLSGADLGEATAVTFADGAATIVSADAESIVVITPIGSRGDATVRVTTPGGQAALVDVFRYQQAVSVTAVTPGTVVANLAATVTLEGVGLQLDGVDPVVQLDSVFLQVTEASATSATVQIPASAIATPDRYDLKVSNVDDQLTRLQDAILVVESVVVDAVAPTWGFLDDRRQVVVSGQGFADATEVLFGGLAAQNFVLVSSGVIEVQAPVSSTAGGVDVTVKKGPEVSATLENGFTYHDAGDAELQLLQLEPNAGVAEGSQVTVYGTGFTSSTAFHFGGVSAILEHVDANQVLVTTPPYSLAGNVARAVEVQAVRGVDTATLADGFTYYSEPNITQVDPTVLSSAGSDIVTIAGAGFTLSTTRVFFGDCEASNVAVANQYQLTCVSPYCDAGTGIPVRLENQFGTSVDWFGVDLVVSTRIVSVDPTVFSGAAGTLFTVEGTGLSDNMLVTITGNQGTHSVDNLIRPEPNILTFEVMGPLSPGSYTLTITNLDTGQEDTATILVGE